MHDLVKSIDDAIKFQSTLAIADERCHHRTG